MGKLCVPPRVDPAGGCVPGCYSGGEPNWCPDESRWWHCNGYPPERLDQMLRVQEARKPDRYNEIVVDVARLTTTWPEGIEAIVYPTSSAARTKPQAEELHRSFVAAFGARAAPTALLALDLGRPAPFGVPEDAGAAAEAPST